MRTLGIALFIAWMTVGCDLLWLPHKELEAELALIQQSLVELEDSPILKIPEVKSQVDYSNHLVVDPSARRIVIWAKWSALFLLVMFGLWSAYAVFRRHSDAMTLMLTGALLFLGREAIFHRASYDLLLQDANPISWYLENVYYQFAISSVWYHRILPVFFLLVAVFSCIHLVRKRPQTSALVGS
jgi:hypothetical protein